ncbi:histone H1-delta-like [Clytia hemisphaerica]|uniref:histone H1-delta-like n=1 Tax=Clytia hemisphaerica TaxID=252671 RepID=UPI0034D6AA6E
MSEAQKKKAAPKKPAEHPKYIDMVSAAIVALKERSGSSRQAILKYIQANYKVGDNASVHLKMALKRGVISGVLSQPKGTGASGSFKVVKKTEPKKKAAPKKKPAAKKPAAKKTTKKTTPKKKPAAKKAKSTPKKKTAAKKKPASAAKKPAAKKATKKPAAKKPAAKKPAKKTPKKRTTKK